MNNYRGREAVLLVDDEAIARSVAGRILRQFGYQVTEAPSGPEALRLLSERPGQFDLILLDREMPDMDGPEVVGELLRSGETTPVILCSGMSLSGSVRPFAPSGVAAVIDKPYRLPELLPALRDVLEGVGAGA